MFYFNVEEVKHPLLIAALMIAFTPLLALLVILAMILVFVVMIPVGALMGIGYTLIKFYCLLCIVLVLLPVGAVVGAVILPLIFTAQKSIPECIHHFRRYKITLNELILKISESSSQ
jgi:hypothetical protein